MAVFNSYVSSPEGSFHGILEMVFMVMVNVKRHVSLKLLRLMVRLLLNYEIGQWHAKISPKIYVKMVAVLEA